MGFNLRSAHSTEVFDTEYGELVAAALRKRFGDHVPLGKPGNVFCMPDEMGWSWWSALGAAATLSLGEAATRQLRAVDAWQGVYIDALIDREVMRLGGDVSTPQVTTTVIGKLSFANRLRKLVGLAPKDEIPAEIRKVMDEMMRANGPRDGERGALQVGSLPKLMAEAEAMLRHLKVQPTIAGLQTMLEPYAAADRCDDDTHIQCLGHLWITGTHAIQNRQPLWLVK